MGFYNNDNNLNVFVDWPWKCSHSLDAFCSRTVKLLSLESFLVQLASSPR